VIPVTANGRRDALSIVRGLLGPATMRLMGLRNLWRIRRDLDLSFGDDYDAYILAQLELSGSARVD
jgi:hypothetical protein